MLLLMADEPYPFSMVFSDAEPFILFFTHVDTNKTRATMDPKMTRR